MSVERVLLLGLLALGTAWCAWPFLHAVVLPCMDLPGHVALAAVLPHLGEKGHVLDATFTWGSFPAPNCLFYLLYHAAHFALEPRWAEKLVVGAYLVATPWALLAFARAFGRSGWVAVLGFAPLVQWTFFQGFIDFCLGTPVLLLGFALLQRCLVAPTRARRIGVLLYGGLVFFTHLLVFLPYCIGAVMMVGLAALHERQTVGKVRYLHWIVEAARPLALGAVLAVLWLTGARTPPTGGAVVRATLEQKLLELPGLTLFHLQGDADDAVALHWILAAIGVGLILRSWGRRSRPTPLDAFPGWFFLLLVVVFLFVPLGVGPIGVFYQRTASLAVVFGIVLVAPARVEARSILQVLALATVVTVSLVSAASARAAAMQRLDVRMAGFWEVLEAAPDQSRLAYYLEDSMSDAEFVGWAAGHLGSYHTAVNQGTTSFSFAARDGRIVVQRELGFDFERLTPPLSAHGEKLARYDVLFQLGQSRLEAQDPQRFTLIKRIGQWALYRLPARKH